MNENYAHPAIPAGAETGILKGMYLFRPGGSGKGPRVQLLGSGTILNEVIAAADLLKQDWGVEADIWSCPSFTLLARDGEAAARWNRLHPTATPRKSHVQQCLENAPGPVIASTDYVRGFAEQVRPYVAQRYTVLGTDGFGRSDTREKLRHFFEVDRRWVTIASLAALADEERLDRAKISEAIAKYGIDPEKPNPLTV
jgi:pyruvate dehydrogenase E1 component